VAGVNNSSIMYYAVISFLKLIGLGFSKVSVLEMTFCKWKFLNILSEYLFEFDIFCISLSSQSIYVAL
jgi:hypothetical protein